MIDYADHLVNRVFACVPRKKPDPSRLAAYKIIAHRGAHCQRLGITENTLAAFQRALELGCWGIELDVRTTADEVLVVNHDDSLMRLWGMKRNIHELRFDELRALVPLIPSLDEVVAQFGRRMHLFVELKAPFHTEKSLVNSLLPLMPGQDYHLLSLDEPVYTSLSAFSRHIQLLVPSVKNTEHFCRLSLEKSYGGVLGHYLLLTNDRIKRLQQAGQLTGVGFVDSKYSLYRELNRGVSWMFTNNVTGLLST